MHEMTNADHEHLRAEVRKAIDKLRKSNIDDKAVDVMESASMQLLGGLKEDRVCGPEVRVREEQKALGTSETHEAFGQVSFSRITCHPPTNLYGSNIRHGSIISLTISRSTKYRDLNYDRYHGGEELIEVLLSPAQFAELLTSLNVGFGTTCTISHFLRHRMAPSPEISHRQVTENEFQETCKEVMADARELVEEVKTIFDKKNVNKGDRAEIMKRMQRLVSVFSNRVPYMHERWSEAVEKTETEAKVAVDAFLTHALQSVGAEALKQKLIKLPFATKTEAKSIDTGGGEDAIS